MASINILYSFFFQVSVVFLFIFRGLSYIEKICNLCLIQVADFFLWVFKNDFSIKTCKFFVVKIFNIKKITFGLCTTFIKLIPFLR